VRRFGRGRAMSGDLAVRLRTNPEEPVAMTVAGARGLGNAAVLLSLKDNSEEARLKREIAQATKMQAVGQLGRRRRPRFQQYPDRDPRQLRPHADAPHARRQRL
jgi:hypothetical protein